MITADLTIEVAQRGGIPLAAAKVIVDGIFASMARTLKEGGRIEIRDFGVFTMHARGARIARNPKTGAAVNVPAKRIPHFKPSKRLLALVNAGPAEK
jgi:integration host factor subunit beta